MTLAIHIPGPFQLLFFLFASLAAMFGMVLWIWALVDCLTKEPSAGNDKLIWALVIIFTNWLGALLYLLIRRPTRIREHGR